MTSGINTASTLQAVWAEPILKAAASLVLNIASICAAGQPNVLTEAGILRFSSA